MMKLVIFLLIAFICCNFAIAFPAPTSPQRCEKISLNAYIYYHSNDLTNISVNIGLTESNGQTFISYDSLSVIFVGKYSIDYLCFAYNDSILCQNDTAQSSFPIGNTTFYLHAHSSDFPNSENLQYVFTGFVDETDINLNDGTMFTLENPCKQRTEKQNATVCCTSFKPIPSPKTTSKCKAFKSRTTIYDITDDYFIFATSQANYTFENGHLSFNASFHGNDGLTVEYDFNNNKVNTSSGKLAARPPQTGIIPVSDNFKGFFEMTVHTHNPDIQDDYYVPNARIFYRNSQALIEESQEFTSANNCQYLSTVVSANHVASSQYCCTQFE